MDDPQREAVINALFVMAWKDGQVTAEEKSILDRILVRLGVPRAQIMKQIEDRSREAPGPDVIEETLMDRAQQLEAMQYLIAVCFSDSQLAREELDYIYELATRFHISADELDQLRVQAQKLVDPGPAVDLSAAGTPVAKKPAIGKIKLD